MHRNQLKTSHLPSKMEQTDLSTKQILLRGIIVFISQLDLRKDIVLEKADREVYQGIYFKNKKIGYVKSQFTLEDNGTLAVDQQADMRLNIANTTHPIKLDLQAKVDTIGQLQTFTFSFHLIRNK